MFLYIPQSFTISDFVAMQVKANIKIFSKESLKEDSRHYDGPDTSSIEDYIIGTVTHYIDELCGPQEENGKMICTGPCADELPDYDEDGEALCTKANFLWVLDIE